MFFSAEFPYPPFHGGRSDTWQRILALSEAGVELQLVCWYSNRRGGKPSDEEMRVVKKVVHDLVVLPIEIGLVDLAWRLVNLWRMPSHASARYPHGHVKRELLARIRAFRPAAVWVDGLWPGAFAIETAKALGLPYMYRSHNIEHRYMARQAVLATDFRYKVRLKLNLAGLERFERRVIAGAARVFDISVDDLRFWQANGMRAGQWLPPFVRVAGPAVPADASGEARYDMVFLGNLHTPNNVEGLRWFADQVWPRLRELRPEATALIAGSAPSEEVLALVARSAGIELLANPPDVWAVYRSARVLVNPVRSGSGLNVKSAEMLQIDVPIVSTTIGVSGMPEEIRSQFLVSDDPAAFASAVVTALAQGGRGVSGAARKQARDAFSPSAIGAVIEAIGASVAGQPGRAA